MKFSRKGLCTDAILLPPWTRHFVPHLHLHNVDPMCNQSTFHLVKQLELNAYRNKIMPFLQPQFVQGLSNT